MEAALGKNIVWILVPVIVVVVLLVFYVYRLRSKNKDYEEKFSGIVSIEEVAEIADKLTPVQKNIAIAMAALLVTTSAITLPLMVAVSDPNPKLISFKFLNDIFWFIGLGSLITSSLLIDSVLDDEGIDFEKRFRLLGFGYLFFSVLVSVMSIAITVLFFDLKVSKTENLVPSIPFFFILLGGVSVLVKLMTNKDYDIGLMGIIVGFGLFYILIYYPCIWV